MYGISGNKLSSKWDDKTRSKRESRSRSKSRSQSESRSRSKHIKRKKNKKRRTNSSSSSERECTLKASRPRVSSDEDGKHYRKKSRKRRKSSKEHSKSSSKRRHLRKNIKSSRKRKRSTSTSSHGSEKPTKFGKSSIKTEMTNNDSEILNNSDNKSNCAKFSDSVDVKTEYRDKLERESYKTSRRHFNREDYSKNLSQERSSKTNADKNCVSSADENSEDEIMFDWDNHKWELNKLFFQDQDTIRRGTEEYEDFFKFLTKYQGIQKQKILQNIINKESKRKSSDIKKNRPNESSRSDLHDLPVDFNNRYLINFSLKGDTIDTIMRRLPPLDLEEERSSKRRRLPRKKIEEFKGIILLYLNFVQKKNFEKLQKLRKGQSELPIAQFREEIVRTLADNSIVLIAGDTGCGKSTQVPQFLMQAGYNNIACTQPRRIACISLCKRVSHETLDEHGSRVGYQIRFERKRSEHTKILFLTEGLLLRQVNTDPSLSSYDVIILDEIHERHLHTDFLLGVVKCLLMQNTDIKIILMSATINLTLFSNYFLGKAPVIQVPGRLYPIKLQYFPIPQLEMSTKSDKLNPAPYVRVLNLIDKQYKETERGDVLMFLSGFSEINTVLEAAKLYAQQSRKWVILSLHSNLSITDQEKVFDIPPDGVRKCIISTNIAETSITIDGVRFVVDSGKMKEMSYDSVCKMQKLKEFWVSQASAEQRKGRAGRTGPGVCFRLYSEEQYSSFDAYSTPEIQRVPLDSLVLQMIAMGMPDVRQFPFIEPPSVESLELSVNTLVCQAAVTGSSEQLTTTGTLLAQLPVDVTIGKMLIMGSLFHQAEATLSLAAALSVSAVFTNRAQRDPDCVAAVQELLSGQGDPFTLLTAYKAWLEVKSCGSSGGPSSQRWCRLRGLEEQRFYEITKLRHQFAQLLQQSKLQEAPVHQTSRSTGAERAKRHGELQQLRRMRRQVEQTAGRKTKVLKMDHDGAVLSDGETDNTADPKHLDFNIKNDSKQLKHLLKHSDVRSFRDVIMLKVILSSGLYPNVAIADEHNTYKPNSDQLFHTPTKPFALLHPTSVFSKQPDVLELCDADIVELPGFTPRHPAASKHQLLLYVSLLETNKAFLMNTFRAPALQTLLLFSQSIDSNADFSVIVCDNFIELKFPEATTAQDLIIQTVRLRSEWNKLLELKLQLSREDVDVLEILSEAGALEKVLSDGLVELYMAEPLYSMRRLLPADVKILHKGPGLDDAILDPNPFSGEVCVSDDVRGGVRLTDHVIYNCLLDVECDVTTITDIEATCVYCDVTMTCRTLARMAHIASCSTTERSNKSRKNDDDNCRKSDDPNAKKFYCDRCDKTMWMNIKEIFLHKKAHR